MGALLVIEETFLPTKENIETLAKTISSRVLDGFDNPINTAVQLAAIEKVCASVKEKIKPAVLAEIAKSGKKTSALGAEIEEGEFGAKWDYSSSDAWVSVKAQEDKIAEKRKAIEAIAKNCPEGAELDWTDTDTGEMLTIKRGNKTSSTSFKITLGK